MNDAKRIAHSGGTLEFILLYNIGVFKGTVRDAPTLKFIHFDTVFWKNVPNKKAFQ